MFEGFNDLTIKYFNAIRIENSRDAYKKNELNYQEGVKAPLEEMYYELYNYFLRLDSDLAASKRRCISSAYNDARFSKGEPIKEYLYIRFKLATPDKKNAVGFYFDASLDGYSYGLNIYKMNASGMERVRGKLLEDKKCSKKIIEAFNTVKPLDIYGEKYNRCNYPNEDKILQDWLERKNVTFMHNEPINPVFFKRQLLEDMISTYDEMKDVYFLLKEALK